MHEVISRIQALSAQIRGTADASLGGMSDAQLEFTPSKDRWSSAMIADHLVKSGEAFIPKFEEAVRNAARGKLEPKPYNFSERIGLALYQPGTKIRIPVPPMLEPKAPQNPSEAVAQFMAIHAAFERIVADLPNLEVADARIPFGPFKPRFVPCLESLLMHERYHLDQVLALIEEPGFPPR